MCLACMFSLEHNLAMFVNLILIKNKNKKRVFSFYPTAKKKKSFTIEAPIFLIGEVSSFGNRKTSMYIDSELFKEDTFSLNPHLNPAAKV